MIQWLCMRIAIALVGSVWMASAKLSSNQTWILGLLVYVSAPMQSIKALFSYFQKFISTQVWYFYWLQFPKPPKLFCTPYVCSCLDGHCTADSPCFKIGWCPLIITYIPFPCMSHGNSIQALQLSDHKVISVDFGHYFWHRSIVRPTNALIQPAANFKLAKVRAHVLSEF